MQANVAHARAPLDSPAMAGFTSQVDEVTAWAQLSPGFIREPTLSDEGTIYRPPLLLNVTIWASVEDLDAFVHTDPHSRALSKREEWFVQDHVPNYVLYWSPKDHEPTEKEIDERLNHLRRHGPSESAFTFDQRFHRPS